MPKKGWDHVGFYDDSTFFLLLFLINAHNMFFVVSFYYWEDHQSELEKLSATNKGKI